MLDSDTESWVFWYLNTQLSRSLSGKGAPDNWTCKIFGEFFLYLFVCKNFLPFRYLELGENLWENLKKPLENQIPQILAAHALGGIALNKSERIFSESIENLRELDPLLRSYEVAFLSQLTEGFSADYWEERALEFICIATKGGRPIDLAYNVTHLVFFGTSFGKYNLSEKLSKIIGDILNVYSSWAEKDRNWDLLIEIRLSQIFIGLRPPSFDLTSIKSEEGWFLSDGSDFSAILESSSEWAYYSAYHTTLLAGIYKMVTEHSVCAS